MKWGLPKALMKRHVHSRWGRPVPWAIATYSAPLSALILANLSTISESASSHEIRAHLLSPLSPARLSGYFNRSGWYIKLGDAFPFGHR